MIWLAWANTTQEGNGNPRQCSCLENPGDGGAWWTAIYGVTQSQTQLKWLSSSRAKPYLTSSNPFSMKSMATNLRLKLWDRWNSASPIHVQQTKPRKLNPAFNSESADDEVNSWCHYMLLKRVHFFFALLLLFFFFSSTAWTLNPYFISSHHTETAHMLAKSLQSCPAVCDLWSVAHQAPMSMEISKQKY